MKNLLSRHVVAAAAALLAAVVLSPGAGAQDVSSSRFEVASVKANTSGATNGMLRRQAGGRIEATNMPLRQLITFAYGLQPFRLIGGPDWLASARFDIVARFEGDPPPALPGAPDPIAYSMRALLEDRFHLKLREETRELDVYNLVMARTDARPGPSLKPTEEDCSPDSIRQRMAAGPPPPPSAAGPIQCGLMMNPGRIRMGGMPLSQLAGALSGQVGRIVNDKTGLPGGYDFEMTFAQNGMRPADGPPMPGDTASADSDGPSIFTALQEQLGLKLESGKAPVSVFVIENVEKPTDD